MAKQLGGDKDDYSSEDYEEYYGTSNPEKRTESYQEIVDSILQSTPAFRDPREEFDKYYTDELRAEDRTQAEELMRPYFEKRISDEMEDLNLWADQDEANYKRSLRRARNQAASSGGAIGSEREEQEGQITSDHQREKTGRVRETERTVGSKKLQKGGFESTGKYEGSLVGNMKQAIEDQSLWNREQRLNRYISDSKKYYGQPSSKSIFEKSSLYKF